jgi:hypothetical protein
MTQTFSFRDVEKLSAYLDGQLKPSEVARLEARLQTDPDFASVLQNLRQTRGILRQLPQRRAPRNFRLTPKMVGQKMPMPRAYPIFNYATALATLLLFLTFATNFMAPRLVRTAATVPYGIGGGGGGCDTGCGEPELAMEAAPEAPAAEEPPRAQATKIPDSAEKSAQDEANAQADALEAAKTPESPVSPVDSASQIILAGIAILSALIAFTIRYITIRKWRAKAK